MRASIPDPVRAQRLAQGFAQAYTTFRREHAQEQFRAQADEIDDQMRPASRTISPSSRLRSTRRRIRGTERPLRGPRALIARLGVLHQEMKPPQPRGEPEHRREVVQPADLPTSPASPDLVRNGLLALAVGLALGIGVAFVRERLDERLRGREDFEAQVAAPVLATVPRVRGRRATPPRPGRDRDRPEGRCGRGLPDAPHQRAVPRANGLAQRHRDREPRRRRGTRRPRRTSPFRSPIRANVVVVSCDLRKPRLHRCFGIPSDPGVTSVMSGMKLAEAIQKP